MAAKSHQYICLNKNHKKLLEDRHLEEILDEEGSTKAEVRSSNARKSLENHLERKALKKNIADFEWRDAEGFAD